MLDVKEEKHTDDIVVFEGHVPRDYFEEIQIDDSNDEDYRPKDNRLRKRPSLTDVLSKSTIV
jgi:hypothetical protein